MNLKVLKELTTAEVNEDNTIRIKHEDEEILEANSIMFKDSSLSFTFFGMILKDNNQFEEYKIECFGKEFLEEIENSAEFKELKNYLEETENIEKSSVEIFKELLIKFQKLFNNIFKTEDVLRPVKLLYAEDSLEILNTILEGLEYSTNTNQKEEEKVFEVSKYESIKSEFILKPNKEAEGEQSDTTAEWIENHEENLIEYRENIMIDMLVYLAQNIDILLRKSDENFETTQNISKWLKPDEEINKQELLRSIIVNKEHVLIKEDLMLQLLKSYAKWFLENDNINKWKEIFKFLTVEEFYFIRLFIYYALVTFMNFRLGSDMYEILPEEEEEGTQSKEKNKKKKNKEVAEIEAAIKKTNESFASILKKPYEKKDLFVFLDKNILRDFILQKSELITVLKLVSDPITAAKTYLKIFEENKPIVNEDDENEFYRVIVHWSGLFIDNLLNETEVINDNKFDMKMVLSYLFDEYELQKKVKDFKLERKELRTYNIIARIYPELQYEKFIYMSQMFGALEIVRRDGRPKEIFEKKMLDGGFTASLILMNEEVDRYLLKRGSKLSDTSLLFKYFYEEEFEEIQTRIQNHYNEEIFNQMRTGFSKYKDVLNNNGVSMETILIFENLLTLVVNDVLTNLENQNETFRLPQRLKTLFSKFIIEKSNAQEIIIESEENTLLNSFIFLNLLSLHKTRTQKFKHIDHKKKVTDYYIKGKVKITENLRSEISTLEYFTASKINKSIKAMAFNSEEENRDEIFERLVLEYKRHQQGVLFGMPMQPNIYKEIKKSLKEGETWDNYKEEIGGDIDKEEQSEYMLVSLEAGPISIQMCNLKPEKVVLVNENGYQTELSIPNIYDNTSIDQGIPGENNKKIQQLVENFYQETFENLKKDKDGQIQNEEEEDGTVLISFFQLTFKSPIYQVNEEGELEIYNWRYIKMNWTVVNKNQDEEDFDKALNSFLGSFAEKDEYYWDDQYEPNNQNQHNPINGAVQGDQTMESTEYRALENHLKEETEEEQMVQDSRQLFLNSITVTHLKTGEKTFDLLDVSELSQKKIENIKLKEKKRTQNLKRKRSQIEENSDEENKNEEQDNEEESKEENNDIKKKEMTRELIALGYKIVPMNHVKEKNEEELFIVDDNEPEGRIKFIRSFDDVRPDTEIIGRKEQKLKTISTIESMTETLFECEAYSVISKFNKFELEYNTDCANETLNFIKADLEEEYFYEEVIENDDPELQREHPELECVAEFTRHLENEDNQQMTMEELIFNILQSLVEYETDDVTIVFLRLELESENENKPNYELIDVISRDEEGNLYSAILKELAHDRGLYRFHPLYILFESSAEISRRKEELDLVSQFIIIQDEHCYVGDRNKVLNFISFVNQQVTNAKRKIVLKMKNFIEELRELDQDKKKEKSVEVTNQDPEVVKEIKKQISAIDQGKMSAFKLAQCIHSFNTKGYGEYIEKQNLGQGGSIMNRPCTYEEVRYFDIAHEKESQRYTEEILKVNSKYLQNMTLWINKYFENEMNTEEEENETILLLQPSQVESKMSALEQVSKIFREKNVFEEMKLPKKFPRCLTLNERSDLSRDHSTIVFDIETSSKTGIAIPLMLCAKVHIRATSLYIEERRNVHVDEPEEDEDEAEEDREPRLREIEVKVPEELVNVHEICFGVCEPTANGVEGVYEIEDANHKQSVLFKFVIWLKDVQRLIWQQVLSNFDWDDNAEQQLFFNNLNNIKQAIRVDIFGWNSSGFDLPLLLPYIIFLQNNEVINVVGDLNRVKTLNWGIFMFKDIFLTISEGLADACSQLLTEDEKAASKGKDDKFNIVEKGGTIKDFITNYADIKEYCIRDVIATKQVTNNFMESYVEVLKAIQAKCLQFVLEYAESIDMPISEDELAKVKLQNLQDISLQYVPTTISSLAQLLFNGLYGVFELAEDIFFKESPDIVRSEYEYEIFYEGTVQKDIHQIETLSYLGGLTMVLNYEKLKRGYYVDINSLYPAVIAGEAWFSQDFLKAISNNEDLEESTELICTEKVISKPTKYLGSCIFKHLCSFKNSRQLNECLLFLMKNDEALNSWDEAIKQRLNLMRRTNDDEALKKIMENNKTLLEKERNLNNKKDPQNSEENILRLLKPHYLYRVIYYKFFKKHPTSNNQVFIPISVKCNNQENIQFQEFNALEYWLHNNKKEIEKESIGVHPDDFSVNTEKELIMTEQIIEQNSKYIWGVELENLIYCNSLEYLLIDKEFKYAKVPDTLDLYGFAIKELYEERLESKKNQKLGKRTPNQQVYKLVMNSSYGKFAQRNFDREKLLNPDQLQYFIEQLVIQNEGDVEKALHTIKNLQVHQTVVDYIQEEEAEDSSLYNHVRIDQNLQDIYEEKCEQFKEKEGCRRGYENVKNFDSLFKNGGKYLRHPIVEVKTQKPEYHQSQMGALTFVASNITAEARASMAQAISHIEFENVYYMDTDSLIVTEAGYEELKKLKMLNNQTLGMFKNELEEVAAEGYMNSFQAFAPKVYMYKFEEAQPELEQDKKKIKTKMAFKGVKRPTAELFKVLKQKGEIEHLKQFKMKKVSMGAIQTADVDLHIQPKNKAKIDAETGVINYFDSISQLFKDYDDLIGLIRRTKVDQDFECEGLTHYRFEIESNNELAKEEEENKKKKNNNNKNEGEEMDIEESLVEEIKIK